MKYTPTAVDGVTIVDLEPHRDEWGALSRSLYTGQSRTRGHELSVKQGRSIFTAKRGSVRGLQASAVPEAGASLVRCTRGAIMHVAVDVRPESEKYGQHVMVALTADNRRALLLSAHVAHGFQTLMYDTEVHYQLTGPQPPVGGRELRWDEDEFGVSWPLPVAQPAERNARRGRTGGRYVGLFA